jgi:hypothetical protein
MIDPETNDLLVASDLDRPVEIARRYPVPEWTADGRIRYVLRDELGCIHYLEDGGRIQLARFENYCLDGLKFLGMTISAACFAHCSLRNTEFVGGMLEHVIFEASECSMVLVDTSVRDVKITASREGSHLRLHRAQIHSLLLEKCRQLKLDVRFSATERVRITSCEIIGGAWERTEFAGLELCDTTVKNLRSIQCRFPRNFLSRTHIGDSYVDGDFSFGLWTEVKLSRVFGRIVADFSRWFEVDARECLLALSFSFGVLQSVQMVRSRVDLTCNRTSLDAVGLWRCHGAVRLAASEWRSLRANDSVLEFEADCSELLAPTVRRSRVRGRLKHTKLIQAQDARALTELLSDEGCL